MTISWYPCVCGSKGIRSWYDGAPHNSDRWVGCDSCNKTFQVHDHEAPTNKWQKEMRKLSADPHKQSELFCNEGLPVCE